jgi:hypothetical protein
MVILKNFEKMRKITLETERVKEEAKKRAEMLSR